MSSPVEKVARAIYEKATPLKPGPWVDAENKWDRDVEKVARAIYEKATPLKPGPWVDAENKWDRDSTTKDRRICFEAARVAISTIQKLLEESEFKRGPSGGHGERSAPSIADIFAHALSEQDEQK